ncbi:hypothetical protein ENUP19_0064G0017 [Entamoeba nuttalli]|uniref:Uncharacterized protein n=2 Tax=Entamoeba nuttalli TaxID=412467 RepID=K2H139_ENTNP|nr:hypothetical protein ENU1_107220 [Entamoeba nuttalli P19]EKE39982.1 hypothetical protein ENU1_107220 [Entamoeba nuttalli P19]|eukprot:XP_008857686.1 hypothetical protein ENU1_107220 [Entamoeba nuttalli P19]
MIVLQYLDSLESLYKFNCICKHCDEAVKATKINPNYSNDSLDTLLQNSEVSHIQKEIKVFPNLETLQLSNDCLEQLYKTHKSYLEESIKLIKITDYILKEKENRLISLKLLQEKIVEMKLDCDYLLNGINLFNCHKLHKLTLRIGNVFQIHYLKKYIEEIKTIPFLQLTCIFHSKHHQIVSNILNDFPKTKLICCWVEKSTCNNLIDLVHHSQNHFIGVSYLGIDSYSDFNNFPFILLPHRNGQLEFANEMVIEPYFSELLKNYYPGNLEIVGKKLTPLISQNNFLVDLSYLNDITKLSLLDSKTKNIKYILPSSLKELKILNFASFDDILNINEIKLKLNKFSNKQII